MGKMPKIVLGALGAWCALALLHASLNLGFHPGVLFGRKEVKEEVRFRVGFLPVT